MEQMDVNHPAARMLINVARAQQEEIGDGTTTCTILAKALVSEGVNHVVRGVPVVRVIQGMRQGIKQALELIEQYAQPVKGIDEPILERIAYIAGRENKDIAELVVRAAQLVGGEKLRDENFRLSDTIIAQEGADNEVFMGLILNRERPCSQVLEKRDDAKVLVIDDVLGPEEIEEGALGTEVGFNKYLELQEEFRSNLNKLVDLDIGLVLTSRSVHNIAEEVLADAGIFAVDRLASDALRAAAEHTGARLVKRSVLKKSKAELESCLGFASHIYEDEKLDQVRILGGKGKPMATMLVGAATEEVVGERERIARDAASSLQAAVKGGVVPGGGAVEIAVARELAAKRQQMRNMSAYGVDAVIEALKRPLAQIASNSGFNPLEKVEEVWAAQLNADSIDMGLNPEDGTVGSISELQVVDPALVKIYALKAAGEVAEAILRIDTIIKRKDPIGPPGGASDSGDGVAVLDF